MKDIKNRNALPFLWVLWLTLLALFLSGRGSVQPLRAATATTTANNIILFIGDGMGPEHVKAGGMFANGSAGSLVFESFPNRTTMTHNNATGGTTDSAASATAMATGVKVNNGVISVRLPGDGGELQTQLEIYKALGKSTGIVSTSYITDASPAAFGAHETSRGNRSQIFTDYINQTNPTVILGGGGNGFDGSAAQSQGYTVVSNRNELLALNTESPITVAGGFGGGEIPADGMSGRDATLPTLPEMTETALKILDNNPGGLFLVVEHEGSDNYSHSNNTQGMVRSVKELNAAVQTAVDWQASHPDTIILVTADHETGDLTVTENNPQPGSVPVVDWGSGGHTKTAVPVYAAGVGASQITGAQIDNTDIFTLLGPTGTSAGATVSFQDGVSPTAAYSGALDTMIAEAAPTTNFGSSVTCVVDGDDPENSQDKSVLLSWDISDIDAAETVYAAAITLNITNGSADQYGVYMLKRSWQEMQATWQQYDSSHGWNQEGAKGINDRDFTLLGSLAAPSTGQATIALNSAGVAVVQGWVDGTIANQGVIIADPSATDGVDFDCRETTTATNRPKLTVSYGGTPPLDLVDWIWSGAITTGSAAVNARVKSSSDNVNLLVSEYNDLSSPATYGPLSANSGNGNTVSFDLSSLAADRQYHYAVQIDGQIDDLHRGTFRTFPNGPFSFSFAIAGDAEQGSNMPVFDAVREEQTRFFINPGDFMYSDIGIDNVDLYRSAYADSISQSRQSELYRSMPIAYMWDDHDFATNNSNKNAESRPAARQAYQEIVPHYPLDAAGGAALNSPLAAGYSDVPIYQSFAVGRAYFIMTDLRSERDPPGDTNDANRTMMGAAQKAWFKQQLIYARSQQYTPVFWLSSVPWIASPANNADHWGGYHAERVEIANFIKDNDIRNLVVLAADSHMIALDDGTNSDYATGGGAPMPVFQAAALHRGGSVKGGPYSHGTYANPTPSDGQYAVVEVTDSGGLQVGVRFTGKRLPAATLFAAMSTNAVEATTTLIDWSTTMNVPGPTAVTLQGLSAAPPQTADLPLALLILVTMGLTLGMVQSVRGRHRG